MVKRLLLNKSLLHQGVLFQPLMLHFSCEFPRETVVRVRDFERENVGPREIRERGRERANERGGPLRKREETIGFTE